ncbi:MAG: hypothetical protein CME01_00675 [Geminicoccus sp.]|nr:hypothetical protein [Geminicoccus sp.]
MTTDAKNKQAEAAELDKLRAEIDRLDQELVERIHARSKVAMEVGEVKKRYSDTPVFLRPGREASMLRRAAAKHGTHPFPASSLLRIWREIIPAVTSLEGDLSLAIEDDAEAVAREHAQVHYAISLDREHFANRDAVAEAVLSGQHTLGIIRADINDPAWWQRVTKPNANGRRLHVILQLPFIDGPVGGIPRDKAWVLAAFAPESSGEDISRILVTQGETLSLVEVPGDATAIPAWAAEQGYEMDQIHMLGFYPEAVRLSA